MLVMRGRHYLTRTVSESNRGEALDSFELALDGDPESVDARIGIARVLIANNGDGWSQFAVRDLTRAEGLLREVLHIGDDNSEAHLVMGILRRQQGRFDESRFELEKALHIAPNVPATVAQLGITLILHGHPEAAIPWVETGLRLAPRDSLTPMIHYYLGFAHLLLDHIEDSIKLFRMSLAGNPRVYAAHLGLAAALGLRGELDEAAIALRQAIALKPAIRSLATQRAQRQNSNPNFVALSERTYCAGLRQAGLPEE
jgi:Flp pilus assembly protein TadD